MENPTARHDKTSRALERVLKSGGHFVEVDFGDGVLCRGLQVGHTLSRGFHLTRRDGLRFVVDFEEIFGICRYFELHLKAALFDGFHLNFGIPGHCYPTSVEWG